MDRKAFSKGTTQYLYGSLSNPFQVTASRAPDNVLTVYYYDDFGALYALELGGARYYVGSDHLGTPKVITENTGNIVRQMEYDSWGVKTSDTNPGFDLPVGFAGGIPDDATGLVRFGFRDYEPETGRWAAKDLIFFDGGQANLYVYVGNDSVNYRDLSGLDRYSTGLSTASFFVNRLAIAAPEVLKPIGIGLSAANVFYSGYLASQGKMSSGELAGVVAVETANMFGGIAGMDAFGNAGKIAETLTSVITGTYTAITGAQDAANTVCPVKRGNR